MINELTQKIDSRIAQFLNFKDESIYKPVLESIEQMVEALKKGNKILIFGNGGSATQSSHFAAELVNKFYFERKPLPAVALTVDTAGLTSIANDMDYKYVFSRQLEALGKPGDIAVGLTTGGRSPNVLEALDSAKKMGLFTIALCGNNTELLKTRDIHIIIPVPSGDTPVIQELHLFILHMMAEMVEKNFLTGDK
jgi:D-sedoheptulose 7-phosphate isomerase